MEYKRIRLETVGHVALLYLCRPHRHNAIDLLMARELLAALGHLAEDASVRAMVVTGEGERAFCAGADMAEAAADPQVGTTVVRAVGEVLRFPKPVVAAVNGYAYGAGAILAIYCDLRLACPEARFRFPGAEYGLVTGAAHLPRLIGLGRAKEIVFTARVVEAHEALEMGLVNRIVPKDQLVAQALALAHHMASLSPQALAAAKEVMDLSLGVWEAVRREAHVNQQLRLGQDYQSRFRQASQRVTGRQPPVP